MCFHLPCPLLQLDVNTLLITLSANHDVRKMVTNGKDVPDTA